MATEIELKLKVIDSTDIVKQLRAIIPDINFELKELVNVYFDTADFKLNQHKMAVRIREKQGKYIQTLKTKGVSVDGLHQRGEWEWEVESKKLESAKLLECECWPNHVECGDLVPVFETNFNRHEAIVNWKGAKIEIAYDVGTVIACGLSEEINELELELLSGDKALIIDLGNEVRKHMSLEQYDVSKAERGYGLYQKSLDSNL